MARTKYLPEQTVNAYVDAAMRRVDVRKIEDGSFFAEIPGFSGVWASNPDLELCAAELREVLLDWLVLKIEQNDRDIPVLNGLANLNVL